MSENSEKVGFGQHTLEEPVHLETVTVRQDLEPGNTIHQELTSIEGDSDDPQSWPKWKRELQIWMIAVHSMVSTFMAAGIILAYERMAKDYGVSVHQTSYLSSAQVHYHHRL